MSSPLSQLRGRRTIESNRVRATIARMLTMPAAEPIEGYVLDPAAGLPTWWPFWSNVVIAQVRELVRTARALEAAEQHAENDRILARTPRR